MKATDDEEAVEQHLYQSLVGSLMYLSVCTRPDLTYAVGILARFSSKPNRSHWTAAKRVLRYLKGTANHGIAFTKSESGECLGYSDADWAGDQEDRKSSSGYLFQMAGGPVSWKSRKQDSVALSRAEAEYIALSSAARKTEGSLLNSEWNQMDQLPSWRTTNLLYPWPRIPNFTVVPSTLTFITTSLEKRSMDGKFN